MYLPNGKPPDTKFWGHVVDIQIFDVLEAVS